MNWNKTFIEISELVSKHSKCIRNKVGAILVKDNRIISIGYNGTPHGYDNNCEIGDVTVKEVIHAESNAITKCAKSVESTKDSILYCTTSPCFDCVKLIIQSGIKEIYFKEKYRDVSGLELLTKLNIKYHEI